MPQPTTHPSKHTHTHKQRYDRDFLSDGFVEYLSLLSEQQEDKNGTSRTECVVVGLESLIAVS